VTEADHDAVVLAVHVVVGSPIRSELGNRLDVMVAQRIYLLTATQRPLFFHPGSSTVAGQ
jgi:hypothetical protein